MSNKNNNNIFGLKNLPKNVPPAAAGAGVPTANLLGLNEPRPFDAALFLDNDAKYIRQVAACDPSETMMKAHKVAGSQFLMGKEVSSGTMTRYLDSLSEGGKAFGKMVVSYITFAAKLSREAAEEYLDEGAGIREGDVRVVQEWVARNAGKNLAVLLDWDRTITTIEGGFYTAGSFEEMMKIMAAQVDTRGLTLENMMEYYVGGPRRLAMLQDMFDFLYTSGNVTIYILTNNRVCIDYPTLLAEMASVLTRGRPIRFICSASHGQNKQSAILATGELKHLCPMKGGKRRKKTRRVRGKKQITRRR